MISNGSIIARTPLQIYCSALVFSPKKSLVWRAFSEQTPAWLVRYRSPYDKWDQCIFKLPLTAYASDALIPIAFSPDSSTIAFNSGTCVDIWSSKSGISIASLEVPPTTDCLLFSPDGKHLALTVDKACICLFDMLARTIDYVLKTQNGSIEKFLFSPNGVFLVSVSQDQITMWTVVNGEFYWSLTTRGLHDILETVTDDTRPNPDYVPALEISNDSSMIATVSPNNVVTVWNVEAKSLQFQISLGDIDDSINLGFSANDDLIIVKGREVIHWDPNTGTVHTVILSIGNSGNDQNLDSELTHWLSPDRSTIAILRDRCNLFLCNATTGECSRQISCTSKFQNLCFSRIPTCLALLSEDKVHIYDFNLAGFVDTLPVQICDYAVVQFSPDGSMLAHVGSCTKILDVSVMPSLSVREKDSYISQIRLSVDGTMVFYARQPDDEPTELCLMDILHNDSRIIESGFLVNNYSISPDNNYLIAQGGDAWDKPRSHLYNLQDKTSVYIDSAGVAAFSSSSQLLAIAGVDFKVRIWDRKSRGLKTTLDGHSCAIAALKFSPGDTRLVSIDVTGKAIVWTYRSNGMETVFLHPSAGEFLGRVVELAFSSDESMLAYTWSGYMKNEGYLWGLETNALLRNFVTLSRPDRRTLSFSDDGRYLRTHMATIDLLGFPSPRTYLETIDLLPSKSPCLDIGQPLNFTGADNWIRWHGRKVLRAPDDWAYAKFDSWGNKLAMVNNNGEVAFIEFDPQELRMALSI